MSDRVAAEDGGRRVTVDHGLCSGAAYCQQAAPEVFEVRDRRAWVRPGDAWSGTGTDSLRQAEADCPWMAIEVEVEVARGPGAAGPEAEG